MRNHSATIVVVSAALAVQSLASTGWCQSAAPAQTAPLPPTLIVESTPLPPPPTVELRPMSVPAPRWLSAQESRQNTEPQGEDPVVELRVPRVLTASLSVLGGTAVASGLGLLLLIASTSGGGGISGGAAITLATMGSATWLFAMPALYTWTGSLLGGNGTYWGTFAGNFAGTAIMGLALIPAAATRTEGLVAWSTFAPFVLLTGLSVGYELTTRARPTVSGELRRSPTAQRITAIPGMLLNDTQRGLTLSGVF